MASGRLGAVKPTADTNTSLYQVPADTLSTFNVSVCNQHASSAAEVRVSVVDGGVGALSSEDHIEYDFLVPPKSSFERTAIVLGAGHSIVVRSSIADVSFVAWGYEKPLT